MPRSRSTLNGRSPTDAVSPNKQASRAAAESVMLWRDLADVAGRAGLGVVIVQDTEAGQGIIVFANSEASQMSGYSRSELVGRVAWELLSPSFISPVRERYGRRATGEDLPRRYRVEARRKDGTTCPVEVAIGATTYRGRAATVAYYMDVSERQRVEEALRESQERLKALFEHAPDCYYLLDSQGTIVDGNRAAEEISGYRREELIGKNILEANLLPPEEIERAATRLAKIARRERPDPAEFTLIRKDGSRVTLETSVFPVAIGGQELALATGRDITERKRAQEALRQAHDELETRVAERTRTLARANRELKNEIAERKEAEEKLRQSEERFRSLIENASDVVLILGSDGTIAYESPAVERMLGYTPEDVVGSEGFGYVHPDDLPKAGDLLAEILQNHAAAISAEVRVSHKDGSWRVVEAVGQNRLDDPAVEGIVVNFRDVTERYEAEEALRASEEKYRLVVENANEAIVVAQEGMLRFANAKAVEVTGYSKEEMVSKPFVELIHPDDQQMVVERHLKRLAGEAVPDVYPFRIVDKGGSIRWVEINAVGLSWDGRPATLNFLTDITERQRAEEALQQSEQQFRALIENSLDGIAVLDGDLSMRYVSPSVVKINGYEPEELVGKRTLDYLHPDDARKITEALESAANSPGEAVPVEVRFRHKDGSWRVLEGIANDLLDDPIVRGIVVNFRDVTERKQVEEALRHSEEYFRSLIENAQDAIAVVEQDGTIRYASPSFERMMGHKLEDNFGQSALRYVHEDDLPRASDKMAELLQNPGGTIRVEMRVWHRDGSLHTLEVVGKNLLHEPAVGCIVANMRDITDKRKSEEDRQRIEQQLQLAGRLAAVGELAAGVAHEVNNPLSAIQAFAQFLASRDDLDEAVKRDVETIYREAQRATRITGNLLSFARRDRPEMRSISMNEVVERSLELHAYRMKLNSIQVATDLAPDLPGTMADFNQMQQVFVNIIGNAEQAMSAAHGRGTLCVKTEAVGGVVRTTFTDDGPGISEEDLKVVFDPFFTTKQVGSGTGLGLSICYGLVEGHGGHLYARSKLGEGATFVVEIPIGSEGPLAGGTRPSSPLEDGS